MNKYKGKLYKNWERLVCPLVLLTYCFLVSYERKISYYFSSSIQMHLFLTKLKLRQHTQRHTFHKRQ